MTGRLTTVVLFLVFATSVCVGCKDAPKPDVQAEPTPAPVPDVPGEPEEIAPDTAAPLVADVVTDVALSEAVAAPDGEVDDSGFARVDIVIALESDSTVGASPTDVVSPTDSTASDVVAVGGVDGGAALTDAHATPVDLVVATDAAVATDGTTTVDGTAAATEPVDAASLTALDVEPAAASDVAAKPVVDADVSRKVFDEFKKFVETGDFEKGAQLLEEWLKKSPMDLANRQNLVHILLKLEQHERALPHLRFMADEAENKGEWLGHLGRALVAVGEYARAAEALAEGLALRPKDVDLLLDLARVHATRKDWLASKGVLEKGLLLEKRLPDVLAELAAVLVELGEYKDASGRFKQLQRLQPTYETAITMAKIASQYDRCDDVIDALVDWEKEFADETPHLLLGACATKADEKVKAQKHFLLGLKANDKCFYCALWLGDLYLESQDWENAVRYYALAAPINPRDYRPFHQLGKSLANQGKHIQAARALQKADERKANDPEILYPLGMELVRAGEKATAWDVWAKLEPLDRAHADEIKALLIKIP
jgi:tetratricopeptide (TPR) repeat protein